MHNLDLSALGPRTPHPAARFGNGFPSGSEPPEPTLWQDAGSDTLLRNRHILVVEDEATVAFDLEYALMDRGAKVIGPVGTLAETLALIDTTDRICAAILDVRISDGTVYPAARLLAERGVPFLFHTGHAGEGEIAERFPDATVCIKPQRTDDVLDRLGRFFVR